MATAAGVPRRDGPTGELPALPTSIFNRLTPRILLDGTLAADKLAIIKLTAHTDCTWVKSLEGTQVGPAFPAGRPGWFLIPVTLNGEHVEALTDTGYRRTLVHSAQGAFTPERLRMQCIHSDIERTAQRRCL